MTGPAPTANAAAGGGRPRSGSAAAAAGTVFHGVENFFPWRGKPAGKFSMAWKTRFRKAAPGGRRGGIFPRRGKLFSTVWKAGGALAVLLAAGCTKPELPPPQLPPGQDVVVGATLSTNRIRIGDPVELTLTVLHRDGTTVEFPHPGRDKEVIVRDARTESAAFANGVRRTIQKLTLTSLTVTNHVIASNGVLKISTPEGLHWTNAYPLVTLEVVSALPPGEESPRPLKSALARWPAPPGRWLWWLLALLAIGAGAAAALRRWLLAPQTVVQCPAPPPPHLVALDALAALRAKGWIETRLIEPFYVELSRIVRRYLEDRFGLRAPERTTEEFIREAGASRALSPAHRELVAGFLEQSDLVKFARHEPDSSDMRQAFSAAERLVIETRPPETPPAGPSAPATAEAARPAHGGRP